MSSGKEEHIQPGGEADFPWGGGALTFCHPQPSMAGGLCIERGAQMYEEAVCGNFHDQTLQPPSLLEASTKLP